MATQIIIIIVVIIIMIILPDKQVASAILPHHRRVRPKADVSSISGCISATRQHTYIMYM